MSQDSSAYGDVKTTFNGCAIGLAATPHTLRVERAGVVREIAVPPLSRLRVTGEIRPSFDAGAWPIVPLRSRKPAAVWPVPGAVQIETLRLYRIEADGRSLPLQRGTDFEVDAHFAGITLTQERDAEQEVLALDYDLRLQRVDVLAEKDGQLRLFLGSEALISPPWPRLPAGWMGLARIHQRCCDRLEAGAVFPIAEARHARLINYPVRTDLAARLPGGMTPDATIDSDTPAWPEAIAYDRHVTGPPEAFARLRRRFREASAFRLAYFGDSITQGGDVDPDWRWTARFSRHLTASSPHKALSFVNAAIGGTSSSVGRERFQRDVLAHRPDAVTILFALNDKKLDDATFTENHRYFIDALREQQIEPILFTSNMNTSVWMQGLDHAEQRIVDFCREHGLICLDAYGIWKSLPLYGIPYESLLGNGINHPDNLSAAVFYELLKRAFFDPSDA